MFSSCSGLALGFYSLYIVDLRILVLVRILKMCDGEKNDNKMAKRSDITHNIVRDRESKGFASELQLNKMHCWNN